MSATDHPERARVHRHHGPHRPQRHERHRRESWSC